MKLSQILLIGFLTLTFSKTLFEPQEGYRGLASSWNVIPSRSLAGLHYIFKHYTFDEEESSVLVTGPVIEITQGERPGTKVLSQGFTTEIDQEDFEEEQVLGKSIFQATTGTGTEVGTAFLVGKNIVLTNRHLLGVSAKAKKWPCGKFSILLNHTIERVACERVRFCSSKFDYCVVELKKMISGNPVGAEVKTLRLAKTPRTNKDTSLLHIGNAAGLGLQASRGRGIEISGGEFFHYAPTLGGSSGAPVFDRRNEVIGINWGQTSTTSGQGDSHAFNRGVLAETIFKELRSSHPYTLKDIKSFRAWDRREHKHRQVIIRAPASP